MIDNHRGVALAAALAVVLSGIAMLVFAQPLDAATSDYTTQSDVGNEAFKFVKNVGVWFMLIMVAFLMIFIKKFEWGVCLAVLLSAAASYIVYAAIQQFYFDEAWNQDLMIRAVVAAITYVIAIGAFLGTVKQWHYIVGGIVFAVVYSLVEWMVLNVELFGVMTTDPGGTIMVHMCAAYFGIGACFALQVKDAFAEPMYTTTHSVTFAWLAAMVLWVLWPTFVCALLPMEQFAWATMTCYMSGLGSILSAYVTCAILQKKIAPLVYMYAMLAGPVAIGANMLSVGPWGAFVIGIAAGVVSAICFIYLQPRFCKKIGVLDVMGVNNLHAMAGWVGVVAIIIILAADGSVDGSLADLAMAVIVMVVALVGGAVAGLVMRALRGEPMEMFSDDYDFTRTEAPSEEQ